MLTPYDEFPCHQTPYPFSYVANTDYSWDEGYFFGAFNPDEKVFLGCGFRINPNTDMIGGYCLLNVGGRQYTTRFSRCWRQDFNFRVGPWNVEIIEPLKTLRYTLEANDSDLTLDVLWTGSSPAYLEEHHLAHNRGRRTTDQSRYSQPGTVSGFVKLGDKSWELGQPGWVGARDHSWGLYAERPPIPPEAKWLPPRKADGPKRALRFWTVFKTGDYSGFYHLHEDAEGVQRELDDVFGNPLGGRLYKGWNDEEVGLKTARHELKFRPGTRILEHATIYITDSVNREWTQTFEVVCPPWLVQTNGYSVGAWKDGGTFHTYHGSEELALEWDDFDFSNQPVAYTPYGVEQDPNLNLDGLNSGLDYTKPIYGIEYLCRVITTAPDGTQHAGSAHIEHFINGRFAPYGFTD